jgi:hypothetical protein
MSKYNETGERIQVIANILNYCLLYRERTSVIENIGVDPEQVNYCLVFISTRIYTNWCLFAGDSNLQNKGKGKKPFRDVL